MHISVVALHDYGKSGIVFCPQVSFHVGLASNLGLPRCHYLRVKMPYSRLDTEHLCSQVLPRIRSTDSKQQTETRSPEHELTCALIYSPLTLPTMAKPLLRNEIRI
jgi:hypothetical protein